jgi:hypothetical protein
MPQPKLPYVCVVFAWRHFRIAWNNVQTLPIPGWRAPPYSDTIPARPALELREEPARRWREFQPTIAGNS